MFLLMLVIGRGLIGLGVSAALMGAFKAFSMTFPGDRLPAFNGLQLAAGAMGALAGGAPADFMMQAYGWRGLFVVLAPSGTTGHCRFADNPGRTR